MKYLKLFESWSELSSLKLNDVIGSVEDYVEKMFHSKKKSDYEPYGCEADRTLEEEMHNDDIFDTYDIDFHSKDYWKSENFLKFITDENNYLSLPIRFQEAKKRLLELEQDTIIIWRCITVDKGYLNKLLSGEITNLGKYWTFKLDNIRAYMTEHNPDNYLLLFECVVNSNDVDWKKTLLYNLNYAVGYNEAEICLKENSNLQLKKVFLTKEPTEYDDFPLGDKNAYKEISINNIKNKKFTV